MQFPYTVVVTPFLTRRKSSLAGFASYQHAVDFIGSQVGHWDTIELYAASDEANPILSYKAGKQVFLPTVEELAS